MMERAQLVWKRAVELAAEHGDADMDATSLDISRVAEQDTTIVAHGLAIGRTHLQDHPLDMGARRARRLLEAVVARLGVRPEDNGADEVGLPVRREVRGPWC